MLASCAAKDPGGQREQFVEARNGMAEPGAQAVQFTEASSPVKRPTGHAVQFTAPENDENLRGREMRVGSGNGDNDDDGGGGPGAGWCGDEHFLVKVPEAVMTSQVAACCMLHVVNDGRY